ncbi:MAG: hypothetical protein HPY71_05780 [Firmicutes bacterium]|nr:hypothetical protein [Bacillota bacterium]
MLDGEGPGPGARPGVAGVAPGAGCITLDALGRSYRELNRTLRALTARRGVSRISVTNVLGQRYIGTGLRGEIEVMLYGTPGNDLGAFMDGPVIYVYGNAQDGVGNTMNSGKIVVYGNAGDIAAMSMRGGKIFIRGNVGSRSAIHMKECGEKRPLLVVGGTAHDFFGEYMAGGTAILLGLNLGPGEYHKANFIGTGMHGGEIFIRGRVDPYQLGAAVKISQPAEDDMRLIADAVGEFAELFGYDVDEIMHENFLKLSPKSLRPFAGLYHAGSRDDSYNGDGAGECLGE